MRWIMKLIYMLDIPCINRFYWYSQKRSIEKAAGYQVSYGEIYKAVALSKEWQENPDFVRITLYTQA